MCLRMYAMIIPTHSKLKAIPINSIKSYILTAKALFIDRVRFAFMVLFDYMNIKLLLQNSLFVCVYEYMFDVRVQCLRFCIRALYASLF